MFRSRRLPRALCVASALALSWGACANAASSGGSGFELRGPELVMEVTRGDTTLPAAQVPSLLAGDKVSLHLPKSEDPDDKLRDFLFVAAFLRGAVNPPPDDWIATGQGWKDKEKDNTLQLTVPEGAQQMVVLMVPRTQGAQGVLEDAVQGKPGEFVRAGGELYEASLDHARLETFMASIRAQGDRNPEALRKVAPVLASSLGMRLQADCLDKVLEEQAACLIEGRGALVLSDVHTSSLADTLAGAPTDLALQLSATPQAGSGSYSAYIGVARDIARLFGAFNNPQFDYLPALTERRADRLALRLNTAPSFTKPKSVLVVGMPSVEADVLPRLRSTHTAPICAAQGHVLLPVEGAPLVYASDFAHAMALRITASDGRTVDVPVSARADRGGYVFDARAIPATFSGSLRAHLHGNWGFAPFEGPDFTLQRPGPGAWHSVGDNGTLVVGRDSVAVLAGSAPACVSAITLTGGGSRRSLEWEVKDTERLAVTVPLEGARPGPVQLALHLQGEADPVALTLESRAEASRIDTLLVHEGDSEARLSGQRLDQVRALALGDLTLEPGELQRRDGRDVLTFALDSAGMPKAGSTLEARIALADGRVQTLPVTVAPPRPDAQVLSRSVRMPEPAQGTRPLELTSDELLPAGGELVFSLQAAGGQNLGRDTVVEVALAGTAETVRLGVGSGLMPSSPGVLIARLDTGALAPGSFGPLRFRLVANGVAGRWQDLARLVRLPAIDEVACAKGKDATCTLEGRNLFLVAAVAQGADFAGARSVPPGFTGERLEVPAPGAEGLYLRLRDDGEAVARLRPDGA
ncbi:hypothetical protein HT578_09845 [Novosphingobium decolorationis]|uniref:Lipoprotein n=1 Tax=Novosphingobium decolorationis TaxID=2698673 RepID=A0ABX8ECC7_9SPHN|nr:hypothetical protein HT578_09845 [Novosphingobium decolorationis]